MEVELREETDFKNPYFKPGGQCLKKMTRVPVTDYYRLRMWKEHFFKFKETLDDADYFMDREEMLDIKAIKLNDLILQLRSVK